MSVATHPELDGFARDNALDGLTEKSLRAVAEGREGYTIEKAKRFLEFQARIDAELLKHPIITDNAYTAWFEHGRQSHEQLVAFIVQFSVFSNQFLVAQLQKTLNADTLEGMRASKEILANEMGLQLDIVSIPKIVSKWVGETEKNVRQIFAQARASNTILLFDEADSLFAKRVKVTFYAPCI